MALKSYRELIVWQKAMDLVEVIYNATRGFPKEELFCLTQQLRRAAISIPSNVAEGQGRDSTKDCIISHSPMARSASSRRKQHSPNASITSPKPKMRPLPDKLPKLGV